MTNGFCGGVKKCVNIVGSRVYYFPYHENEERMAETEASKPDYCSLKTVNFVRNTAQEMSTLSKLSWECVGAINAARDAISADYLARAQQIPVFDAPIVRDSRIRNTE